MALTRVTYFVDEHDRIYNAPTTLTFLSRDEAIQWAIDKDPVFEIVSVIEEGVGPILPPWSIPPIYEDDPLFGGIPIEDLPTASAPVSGGEFVPGLQNGAGVKFLTSDLIGTPLQNLNGASRDRIRWFTDFEGHTAAVTANSVIVGDSKMLTALSGTGAQVAQGAGLGELGIADLNTGTTTTGRCGLTAPYPALFLFIPSERIAFGARIRLPAVSDGTDTYRVVVGFGDVTTLSPADASIRFVSPAAAGNWAATIRDDGAEIFSADTGVATDNGGANFHVFVVEHTDALGTRFWIDGNIVATEATIEPDALANYSTWGVGIIKSAGVNARILEVDAISWDVFLGARMANMP